MWDGQAAIHVLGASRGSQTSSVPLDLPGQEAEVVLIPSAQVANGYGKPPAGPAGPGCHPQLCLCTSSWAELLEQFRFTAPRTPGRGSVWKNTGRLLLFSFSLEGSRELEGGQEADSSTSAALGLLQRPLTPPRAHTELPAWQ